MPDHDDASGLDPQGYAQPVHDAVVTNNVKDFRRLHADYLKANTTHHGIVYIPTGKYGLRRDQLGSLITALDVLLNQLSAEDALRDREYFL